MRESSQVVRIERHRIDGDLTALTFADPAHGAAVGSPMVVVLHGLGSRKERHLDLCLSLAARGATACAIDARGHGDRATAESRRLLSDRNGAAFLPAFTATVESTVVDVIATATYFQASHYDLIGHSMGGFIALQTAMNDPRVADVVCISGALDVSAIQEAAVSADVLAAARMADPVAHVDRFPPRRVLLLHGDADETVPVRGARKLWAALQTAYARSPQDACLKEYAGAGHDLQPVMVSDAVRWTIDNLLPEVVSRAADQRDS